jgi:hypothetical protein
MKRTTIRNGLAALLIAGFVGFSAAASASSKLEGVGLVWDKDLEYRTVTIGRNVYHLTDRTALVDRGGERVAFVRLPVARDATGQLTSFTQAAVEFTADERRGRLFLETLRLLDR